MNTNNTALQAYYDNVQENGLLLTDDLARRWSGAVLRTLGYNMAGNAKKKLAGALPAELARELTRGFKLVPYTNSRMTTEAFFREVAGRSGNTDPAFAETVTLAVFSSLKQIAGSDLSRQVGNGLPREIGSLWNKA